MAQAELDNVLNGRLPEHSDILSLPYVSAIVKEVYRYAATCTLLQELHTERISTSRWEPVAPLSNSLFLPSFDGISKLIFFSSRYPASVDQR